MQKMHLGTIHADFVTKSEAIDRVIAMAKSGLGGFVVTPNVDHIILAETNFGLRAAYADASLSLVDGMPLMWASRLAGFPLPEKISGSDFVRPLLARAAEEHLRVFLLGAAPGVGEMAADRLKKDMPALSISGTFSPRMGFDHDASEEFEIMKHVSSTSPDIVLVALGCPKQELLMHRWRKQGFSPVMLGIGATLDFIAGTVKRSPAWVSAIGFEWLYRMMQDPRRLIKRYLIQDSAILRVFLKMMRIPKERRVFFG
jgi:N-acetylglucosaminyldiphosphoundecaprenol N-acetyl-beta-D-mannosaminyltransferase